MHIVFGVDLVGVSVGITAFMHPISCMDEKILTTFIQIHHLVGKKLLDFGDLY